MKISNEYINIPEEQYKINLDSNENYIDIDKNVLMKIKSALMDIQFHKYPKDNMEEIKKLYAQYAGCSTKNIIVGSGSIEAIEIAISSVMEYGKKALTFTPDFKMYDFFVSRFGGDVKKYNLDCNEEIDINKVIKYANDNNVDLIAFSNPNDPTGLLIKNENLVKLLEECSDKMILIDESYYEFCGQSMIDYIDKYKNLFITRTLSKAWGLAGLRIGFLITNEHNIDNLLEYKIPYTVDSYAQQIAKVVMKYPDKIKENTKNIIKQREEVFKSLKDVEKNAAMNIKFYPSQGNYIYGKTAYKEALIKGLKDKGIIIKNLDGDSFRIAIGSPLENSKLVEGIRKIFVY